MCKWCRSCKFRIENAIYISSDILTPNKMRLIKASLEIEEGKTTIYRCVAKSSKYKEALKIPVVKTHKGQNKLIRFI